MKHFLIFNYDFPKYVRLDVGNETRMHLDKQGRYLLQPNRINGRVYYEQITGWNKLNTLTVFAIFDKIVQKPTRLYGKTRTSIRTDFKKNSSGEREGRSDIK